MIGSDGSSLADEAAANRLRRDRVGGPERLNKNSMRSIRGTSFSADALCPRCTLA